MKIVAVEADQTVTLEAGFNARFVTNEGPGACLIEGQTVVPGSCYAARNGQAGFVVTTFDVATKIGVEA